MDFRAELESLALNALDETPDANTKIEIDTLTAERWRKLFGFTASETSYHLSRHRADFFRQRISAAEWAALRAYKEEEGHDRESYEFSLSNPKPSNNALVPQKSPPKGSYLLKLHGPLNSAGEVQKIAGLLSLPPSHNATDEDGVASSFVIVDGKAKTTIEERFRGKYHPTFVKVAMAEKSLSDVLIYPTLGIETTLPQFRSTGSALDASVPMQDRYPVWYFFYGTLADADFLQRLLNLPVAPALLRSTVKGGSLRQWGGKYRALINGPESSIVNGVAYQVTSIQQEETLRLYETEKYTVVRCQIQIDGRKQAVWGLTFRFVDELELD